MTNEEIGKNLKAAREQLGLTQRELGEIINKTESSIRKYEKGLVSIPASVLLKLYYDLNLDISALINSDENTLGVSINKLLNNVSEYDKNEISDKPHNYYSFKAYDEYIKKLREDIRFECWDDKLKMFTKYGCADVTPQQAYEVIQKLTTCTEVTLKSVLYDLRISNEGE